MIHNCQPSTGETEAGGPGGAQGQTLRGFTPEQKGSGCSLDKVVARIGLLGWVSQWLRLCCEDFRCSGAWDGVKTTTPRLLQLPQECKGGSSSSRSWTTPDKSRQQGREDISCCMEHLSAPVILKGVSWAFYFLFVCLLLLKR